MHKLDAATAFAGIEEGLVGRGLTPTYATVLLVILDGVWCGFIENWIDGHRVKLAPFRGHVDGSAE